VPLNVQRITFIVDVDGKKKVVDFVRREKIGDLLTADNETLGSWLRAIVTGATDGTLQQWLEHYTWVQEDGTVNFSRPRLRPSGLPVDAREIAHLR
jgi:hypothetical protein